jgi:hypothetical protein
VYDPDCSLPDHNPTQSQRREEERDRDYLSKLDVSMMDGKTGGSLQLAWAQDLQKQTGDGLMRSQL